MEQPRVTLNRKFWESIVFFDDPLQQLRMATTSGDSSNKKRRWTTTTVMAGDNTSKRPLQQQQVEMIDGSTREHRQQTWQHLPLTSVVRELRRVLSRTLYTQLNCSSG
ncbi:unnamed protein product [Citrullus colocynthis]|uniref:Uncharacterized protein n=1 Tax=Citrullus colocynthis TaxID=252529 RepID=A0ABP0YB31_9ROSI